MPSLDPFGMFSGITTAPPANYTRANDHHLRYFRYRLGQQCPELYLGEGVLEISTAVVR